MNRSVLLAAVALAGTSVALFVVKDSGLATRPGHALAALPQGQWFVPSSHPDGPFAVPLEGGPITWHGDYGNVVDNMIWHFGLYERAECLLAAELLDAAGGGYLDVGANFGNHAFFLAASATEVHAIEPWPPALERMRAIAAKNDAPNVHIHPVGYSNTPGTLPFYPPPEGSFVVGTFDKAVAAGEVEPIQLPLVVPDAHLAEVGAGTFGLVKVDIEGYERYAFEGMQATLERDRPIVMFELNVTEGGFMTREQLVATFPDDYEFWEIDLDPAWGLSFGPAIWFYGSEATGRYHLRPLDTLRRLNALAVPTEHHDAVAALAAR